MNLASTPAFAGDDIVHVVVEAPRGSTLKLKYERILAVPIEARREHTMTDLDALPRRVLQELEQFTLAATALEGKDVRVVGWGDAQAALRLVRDSARPGDRTA